MKNSEYIMSNIEKLLCQEAARDLENERGGKPPSVGEMQRRFPEEYRAAREFVLGMAEIFPLLALSKQQAEKISEMIHSEDEGLHSIQEILNMQPVNALTLVHLVRLEREHTARKGADAKHRANREKSEKIRAIWATRRYKTKRECAEKECGKLGMKFEAARNALKERKSRGRC